MLSFSLLHHFIWLQWRWPPFYPVPGFKSERQHTHHVLPLSEIHMKLVYFFFYAQHFKRCTYRVNYFVPEVEAQNIPKGRHWLFKVLRKLTLFHDNKSLTTLLSISENLTISLQGRKHTENVSSYGNIFLIPRLFLKRKTEIKGCEPPLCLTRDIHRGLHYLGSFMKI